MTVGYGGVQEFPLRIRWAKVHQQGHNHSGRFHAWTSFGTLCGRQQGFQPTRNMRDRMPFRSCADCAKKAVA